MDRLLNILNIAIQNLKLLLRSPEVQNSHTGKKMAYSERRVSDFPPNVQVNVSLVDYLQGSNMIKTGQCSSNLLALALAMFFKVPHLPENDQNLEAAVKRASTMPGFDQSTSSTQSRYVTTTFLQNFHVMLL
jgi:hypothetical protein